MPFANADGARIYWRVDGRADAPPLIMVSSLGSDHAMWDPVLPALARRFRVIRLDKRGHGASDAPPGDYTMERLGRDVLAVADAAGAPRFLYCGLSIGGMIGMWLGANAPERVERMVLSNTSAKVAREGFDQRITQVMLGGMSAIADTMIGRWFTPRYAKRRTEHMDTVRQTLLAIDPVGYAGCCAAIRDMTIEAGLPGIVAPTLVIGGSRDPSTPPEMGRAIAQAIPGARYAELPTAHFGPSEQPGRFIDLAVRFLNGETVGWAGATLASAPAGDASASGTPNAATAPDAPAAPVPVDPLRTDAQRWQQGVERRKAVLGKAYVEARLADPDPFTAGFQDLVTRYAWGEIWSRPVLDDRTRRLLVLAMMIGLRHWEEFALHVDKGLEAELDETELEELLLVAAVYCGVPAANTAFHHAAQILHNR